MLPLGCHPYARDLPPHLASLTHFLTVLGRGPAMLAWSEVLGDRPMGGEKPLRMPSGLESLPATTIRPRLDAPYLMREPCPGQLRHVCHHTVLLSLLFSWW